MRATLMLCGIKGIYPLIIKECPHAIHYPLRFSDLAGYRIAIDATLLVARFHFSDDEHPARHLIGFHRLISSMRAADIFPIFVFDHLTSRVSAKSREIYRRREGRMKAGERVWVELRREWRMRRLDQWMRRLAEMSHKEKESVLRLLASKGAASRLESPEAQQVDFEQIASTPAARSIDETASLEEWSNFRSYLAEIGEQESSTSLLPMMDHEMDSMDWQTLALETPICGQPFEEVERDPWSTIYEAQTSSSHAAVAQLEILRSDFCLAQERAIRVTPTPRSSQSRLDAAESRLYEILTSSSVNLQALQSARQAALEALELDRQKSTQSWTLGEAKEADPSAEMDTDSAPLPEMLPSPLIEAATSLEVITSQSQSLKNSYMRSFSPLSSTAFYDCAQLCALLKVPVLWTGSGNPHGGAKAEAEALAASLVAAGQADAVATEDSDVLLAEVPLIRHLTSTSRHMKLVDSRAARRCLFPLKVPRVVARSVAPSEPVSDDELERQRQREVRAAEERADRMSRNSMIELALLCGTDYNRTIPGLGFRGALRLLRQHGTIKSLLRSVGIGVPSSSPSAVAAASSPSSSSVATTAVAFTVTPKYRPPDGLSWKEYGAELSRARSIFKNPPDSRRAMELAGIRPWDFVPPTLSDDDGGVAGLASDSREVTVIPPPPPIPLLERLKAARETRDGSRSPRESNFLPSSATSRFAIPKYDRAEVSALLRARGLGTSDEITGVGSNFGAHDVTMGLDDGLGEHLEIEERLHNGGGGGGGSSSSGTSVDGTDHMDTRDRGDEGCFRAPFGRTFGGETAKWRFAWDV